MPRRTLIDHRPWLVASLFAAIAYYVLRDTALGGLWLILLKGAGVGLLAAYALRRAPGADGKLIAGALGLGALGDMAIELDFMAGGAAFFLAHCVAIALYLRHPRPARARSQKAAGIALLIGTPLLAWLLTMNWQVGLYALALGGMAAAAWLSAFPRYRVGIGAVLFVVSDLLIFWREGPFDDGGVGNLLVWPIYYAGQFLIATGVVQTLRKSAKC